MSDVQSLTEEEQRAFEEGPTLLAAAQRCNRYVASDYTPVYVEDVKVRVSDHNTGRIDRGVKHGGKPRNEVIAKELMVFVMHQRSARRTLGHARLGRGTFQETSFPAAIQASINKTAPS